MKITKKRLSILISVLALSTVVGTTVLASNNSDPLLHEVNGKFVQLENEDQIGELDNIDSWEIERSMDVNAESGDVTDEVKSTMDIDLEAMESGELTEGTLEVANTEDFDM